jgi:hypothetical protein
VDLDLLWKIENKNEKVQQVVQNQFSFFDVFADQKPLLTSSHLTCHLGISN